MEKASEKVEPEVPSDRTGGNGHKLKKWEVSSEHKKTIFFLL